MPPLEPVRKVQSRAAVILDLDNGCGALLLEPEDWEPIFEATFLQDFAGFKQAIGDCSQRNHVDPRIIEKTFSPPKGSDYLPGVVYLWCFSVPSASAAKRAQLIVQNHYSSWGAAAAQFIDDTDPSEAVWFTYVGQTKRYLQIRLGATLSKARQIEYGGSQPDQFCNVMVPAVFENVTNILAKGALPSVAAKATCFAIGRTDDPAIKDHMEIAFIHMLGNLNISVGGLYPNKVGYAPYDRLFNGLPQLAPFCKLDPCQTNPGSPLISHTSRDSWRRFTYRCKLSKVGPPSEGSPGQLCSSLRSSGSCSRFALPVSTGICAS